MSSNKRIPNNQQDRKIQIYHPGRQKGLLFGNPLEALYRSVSFEYAFRIISQPDQVKLEGCFREQNGRG
jgi:hypothetical protein